MSDWKEKVRKHQQEGGDWKEEVRKHRETEAGDWKESVRKYRTEAEIEPPAPRREPATEVVKAKAPTNLEERMDRIVEQKFEIRDRIRDQYRNPEKVAELRTVLAGLDQQSKLLRSMEPESDESKAVKALDEATAWLKDPASIYHEKAIRPLAAVRRLLEERAGLIGETPKGEGIGESFMRHHEDTKHMGVLERILSDPLIAEPARALPALGKGLVRRGLGALKHGKAIRTFGELPRGMEGTAEMLKTMQAEKAFLQTAGKGAIPLARAAEEAAPRIAALPKERLPATEMSMDMVVGPVKKGTGASVQEIARGMERVLGTRLNTPLRGAAKKAGVFDLSKFRGAVKEVGDLKSLTHEFGHGMESKLWGIKGSKEAWKPITEELQRAGRALYPEAEESAQFFAREGFAQYWWARLTRNEQVAQQFPLTHPWMDDILSKNPKTLKQVTRLERGVSEWRSQGPRLRAFNQFEDFMAKQRDPVLTRMQRGKLRFQETQYDKLAFAKQMEKDLGLRSGADKALVAGDKSFVETYKFLDQTAPGRAEWDIIGAQTDALGFNEIGPSAKSILERVRQQGHWDDYWRGYHYAKHTVASEGRATGLAMEDAKALVKFYESSPEFAYFREVQPQMVNWFGNYPRQIAELGGMPEEMVGRFFEANPEFMPLKRMFPDAPELAGVGKRGIETYSPYKYRKGSLRPIKSPDALLYDYALEQRETMNRLLLHRRLAAIEEMPGAGKWVWKVSPKKAPPVKVSAKQLKSQIEEIVGVELEGEQLDKMMNIWTARRITPTTEPTIFIWKDGKQVWLELQPDLYRLVKGEGQIGNQVLRLLMGAFASAARLQRLGATALRPGFALSNAYRDFFDYLIWREGKGTLRGLSKWSKGQMEALGGGLGIKQSDLSKFARSTGIDISTYHGIDTAHRIGRDAMRRGQVSNIIRHPVQAFRQAISTTEMGPRLAAGMERAEALGWKPGTKMKMTPQQAVEIGNAISEGATINFRQHGTWSKPLNQIIPFYNPRVQGVVRFAKAFRQNPVRTTIRGIGYITIPTLGLWYHNKDNPDYQDQPAWLRTNFWTIYHDKDEAPMRVPVPFEDGIFKSIPEALVNEAWKKDPEGFEMSEIGAIAKEAAKNMLPVELDLSSPKSAVRSAAGSTALIGPFVEVAVNENFAGKPIVARRDEDLLAEAQVKSYTTGIAKKMGEILGVSPAQIDHLIGGYTGGIGYDAMRAASYALREVGILAENEKEEVAKEAANYWLVGRFFARRLGSSRSVEEMWQQYGLLTTKRRTYRRKKNEKARGWREYQLSSQERRNLKRLEKAVEKFRGAMERRDASRTDEQSDRQERRAVGLARRVMGQLEGE